MVRLGTLLAFVLALVLAGGVATLGGAQSGTRSLTPAVAPGGPTQMLVSEGGRTESSRLLPVDPLTLADIPSADVVTLDGPGGTTAVSADGSTAVTLLFGRTAINPYPPEVTVAVRDFAAGADSITYELPLILNGPSVRLSRDGTRMVLMAMPDDVEMIPPGGGGPPSWHVVETVTGRTLATVPGDPKGVWPSGTWIDPDATRLYRLLLDIGLDNTGPAPAVVVAHDLTTGTEIGQIEVPVVLGGMWDAGKTVPIPGSTTTMPVSGILTPGGTLSPDGSRLALVHADGDAVTLIDTARLVVERTVSIRKEAGIGARLASWLPLASQSAAAKVPPIGAIVRAAFAADGRHLYAWGSETEMDDEGIVTMLNLPLRLIDTEGGILVAETETGLSSNVYPAADGSALYTLSTGEPDDGGNPPVLLRRLDPITLALEAERTFPGGPRVILRPSLPSGSDV